MFIISKESKTEYKNNNNKCLYDIVKRIFDVLLSIAAFPAFVIVYIVVAILLKLQDGGSVMYKAERVGKNGKIFYMYKFRTMKQNADHLEDFLSSKELEAYKKEYKLANDPRITKIGDFLRRSSLDELPQIINVIKNDMSLIGPRPIVKEETEFYGEDKDLLLSVKPGLTGYWQAYARNDAGYFDGHRQKMELYYVNNRSLKLDIVIFFVTIKRVITKKGAC